MKKIYVCPETEVISEAWAKCDVNDHASIIHMGDEKQTPVGTVSTSEEASSFVVGAKQFIWDDEDSPWNN